MSKRQRMSFFGTLVLVVLLALLTAAPASAETTVNFVQGVFTGNPYVDGGDYDPETGTIYAYGWVATAEFYLATGPDGYRFLGGGAICLDVVVPAKGDNLHWGEVVFTTDPVTTDEEDWTSSDSFDVNVAAAGPTWEGTWVGFTRNKRNHQGVMEVTGVDETDNEGYSAHIEVKSMQFDVANWHSDQFICTPFNMLVTVTTSP